MTRLRIVGAACLAAFCWILACGESTSPPIEPIRLLDPRAVLSSETAGHMLENRRAPPWLTDSAFLFPLVPDAVSNSGDDDESSETTSDKDGYPGIGRVVEVPMFIDGDLSTRDSRAAWLAPSGTQYRVFVEMPPDAELRTALGHPITAESVGGTITFRVNVEVEGEAPVTVLAETMEVRESGGWRDVTVDLSAWAGRALTLDFWTDGPRGLELAWGAWASPEIVSKQRGQDGYDVLMISIDTLRADRLGAYGYTRRPTSPNLDRLAADGIVFETAVSQAPWTRPSHRALFTGLYPASNGGLWAPPLARVLWRSGWRTGALTGGGQVDARFGFHDGFETYRVQYWHDEIDAVRAWFEAGEGRRNFLFLHTFDVHDPYTDHRFATAEGLVSGRIAERFGKDEWVEWKRTLSDDERAYVDALYDGGIASLDERLGGLFGWLEDSGRLDRTVVLITSDHGEQLFEHNGWRHGSTLFDFELLVPLIVHLPSELERRLDLERPRGESWRVATPVRLIDVYPTLVELLDLPFAPEIQGRSLVPLLDGRKLEPVTAFAENVNLDEYEQKALRADRWKFVWWMPKGATAAQRTDHYRLYDLTRDPLEVHDLSTRHPRTVERLIGEIEAILAAGTGTLDEGVPDDVDPDLLERLRSLGYVD
ncbi:MAG: sulfatase [Acidobacteriota bacterium]